MSDEMTSAEIINQRLNNIERDMRDGFRIDPRWLIQTVREMTAALDFYATGRHLTETDHIVVQVVPGNDDFVDHLVGQHAGKCLDRAAGKETK